MYRRKASSLAIKSISSSSSSSTCRSQVRASSLPSFCSSQNSPLNFLKPSPFRHLRRWLSTAAQRFDFPPDSDPNGQKSNPQQDPFVSDGRNSANSAKNLNGYQRSDIGDFQPWNSGGSHGGAPNRSYQQNSLGVESRNRVKLQQNPNEFNRGSSNWSHQSDADIASSVNSQQNSCGFYREGSVGYQRGNLGEGRPPNPNGFARENPAGYQTNNLRDSRNAQMYQRNNFPAQTRGNEFGQQFSQTDSVHFRGHNADGFVREKSQNFEQRNQYYGYNISDNGYGFQNQAGSYGEQRNQYSGYNRADNGYGFQNQGGSYGEYRKERDQNPSSYYNGGGGQQNIYGYTRENHMPNVESNYGLSTADPGEIVTYEDALSKVDGFYEEGKVKEAVAVLGLLQKIGMHLDLERYLKLVQACGEAKFLAAARIIHDHISLMVGEEDVTVNNQLIDVYSKCDSIADAYQLFERMPQKDLASWSTMIVGLADNGFGEGAIYLYTQFKETGLKPDGGLFIALFHTCGVLEEVDQGMLYFESMKRDFGINPTMEHYVSIVDMLGRSSYLDEALEFIEKMPIAPDVSVWETLMKICRANGYAELGDRCFEIVHQLDPLRLTEQSKIGLLPEKASKFAVVKERKSNSILGGKHQVHEYRAGDRSHPDNDILYALINGLAQSMREAGYVADVTCSLHDVDHESRAEALLAHSERLAIAHGLLNSPARTPVRIIKNLRVCRDCHNALKIISKLVGRTIIARDIKRFHHFADGSCSCNDFW